MSAVALRLTPAVDWGPVAAWAGAGATVLVVLVTVLVALGYFERFRGPRLHIAFEPAQPWCRYGTSDGNARALWVRLGVENRGAAPARGCVGRLINVRTDGDWRRDVDPVQLRWAGLPRARAFDPMDVRRGQREYLNVLYAPRESLWRLVTFDDPDFDPGFATVLPVDHRHVFEISVFAERRDGDHTTAVRACAGRTGSAVEAPVINTQHRDPAPAADALGATTTRRAAVVIVMDKRGRA
jgi:hypothetical protein